MRRYLIVAAVEGLLATAFVLAAGRWDVPWFWALLGIHAVGMTAVISGMDPGLLRERLRPAAGGKDRYVNDRLVLTHFRSSGIDPPPERASVTSWPPSPASCRRRPRAWPCDGP